MATTVHAQEGACVDKIHRADQSHDAEYLFDLAFDRNSNNQSFSCDLQMRASDARKAIEDFRYGVIYDSKPHIESSVKFPLSIFVNGPDGQPVQRLIRDADQFMQFKNTQLEKMIIGMIACSNVRNVEVVKNAFLGFTIGGRVWFEGSVEDRTVEVVAISNFPATTDGILAVCTRGLPK